MRRALRLRHESSAERCHSKLHAIDLLEDSSHQARALFASWRDYPTSGTPLGHALAILKQECIGLDCGGRSENNRNACAYALATQSIATMCKWSAAVVPKWRFQEDWEVFATLGALRWELEPSARIGSDRDTDFLYGAGIAHRFDSGLSASFDVQRSSTEYSSLRLGVTYRW
jgi:hypothetical protein